MHFKFSQTAKNFFADIITPEGSHGTHNKNKFKHQFDVYYCCAMIGLAAVQRDDNTSDLKDLIEGYPKPYIDSKTQIAGLLVATEAERQGIDIQSPKLEEMMLQYLNDSETMLSEEGIKALNAYALRGFQLIRDYPLSNPPTSREEFLEAFNIAIKQYTR